MESGSVVEEWKGEGIKWVMMLMGGLYCALARNMGFGLLLSPIPSQCVPRLTQGSDLLGTAAMGEEWDGACWNHWFWGCWRGE